MRYIYSPTKKDILQAINLDKESFTNDDVGTLNKCLDWLSVNKHIYIMVKKWNKVIGYCNIVPLKDEIYNLFIEGKYKDYMLTHEHILPYIKGNSYNLLFMSIVIEKKYRDGMLIIQFTNKIKNKFKKLQNKGIKIKNVIVDAITDDGYKLFTNTFHFKFVIESKGGKILQGQLI